MELIRDDIKIEWDYIGEGLNGEYNELDGDDEPMLRFYVLERNEFGGWEYVVDGSYCTFFSANSSDKLKRLGLVYLMDAIEKEVKSGGSIKTLCEELSWIEPSWLGGLENEKI